MCVEPTGKQNLSWIREWSRSHDAGCRIKSEEWYRMLFNSQETSSTYGIQEVFEICSVMCVIKDYILQGAMRLWNLEQDHRVDNSSFPRQVQHEMAKSIQETCMVPAFGHMELLSQVRCNRIPHRGQKDHLHAQPSLY